MNEHFSDTLIVSPQQQPEQGFKQAWTSIERIAMLLGLLGAVFAAGMNWHRLDGAEEKVNAVVAQQAAHALFADSTYVRKDVIAEQLKNIDQNMNEMRVQMQALRNANRR